MINVFEPAFLIVGLVALLAGAGIGELLCRAVPKYRIIIAIGLWLPVLSVVFAGVGITPAGDAPSHVSVSPLAAGGCMLLIGLVMGAGLMLMQRSRGQQIYGLVLGSAFGVPLLTNFWMGSALAQATYGV